MREGLGEAAKTGVVVVASFVVVVELFDVVVGAAVVAGREDVEERADEERLLLDEGEADALVVLLTLEDVVGARGEDVEEEDDVVAG